jgi:hypothetical protein
MDTLLVTETRSRRGLLAPGCFKCPVPSSRMRARRSISTGGPAVGISRRASSNAVFADLAKDVVDQVDQPESLVAQIRLGVALSAGSAHGPHTALVGRGPTLVRAEHAMVARYDPDGPGMIVVGLTENIPGVSIGMRWPWRTWPPPPSTGRVDRRGVTAPATPICLASRARVSGYRTQEGAEKFTELVATAIANADSREEFRASRARLVAAGDDARRGIERDLHDGAQQRLVSLAVGLRRAEAWIRRTRRRPGRGSGVTEGLKAAVDELRDRSRGITHRLSPEAGVSPALEALRRRRAGRVNREDFFAGTGRAEGCYHVEEGMPDRNEARLIRRPVVTKAETPVLMPSEVSSRVGFFDRFAGWASLIASRATFFAFCVFLIVLWAPSILVFRSVDTWQLIINTATTIITFLLVALLQNSQTRSDQAVQHKLNAIADGLADVMAHLSRGDEERDLERDLKELRAAVGLEQMESTSNNASGKGGSNGRQHGNVS